MALSDRKQREIIRQQTHHMRCYRGFHIGRCIAFISTIFFCRLLQFVVDMRFAILLMHRRYMFIFPEGMC